MGFRRLAAVAVAGALAVSGCAVSGLSFKADNRLHVLAPHGQALVQLPLTLRWTVTGFHLTASGGGSSASDAGYFAVFVDRAPVRPGQTLRAVAGGDQICLHTIGCPDASYLADRQVYVTTSTSLTLTEVQPLGNHQSVQLHEATIVLLNAAGQRIGESAWYVDFRLRKASS